MLDDIRPDGLIAALRGTARRLDRENEIMREALAQIADDPRADHGVREIARRALAMVDALDLPERLT